MNKIVLLFWGTLLSVLMFSCVKENYIEYSTSQKDAVYINLETINNVVEADSVYYNFGFAPADSAVNKIWVRLMGFPRDYDRHFGVKVITDRVVADGLEIARPEYYSVPETMVLKADSLYVLVPVTLKRHKDLEKKTVVLTVELTATDELDVRGQIRYTYTFDDKDGKVPAWWLYSDCGEYSLRKARLFFKYFQETKEGEQKVFYDRIVQQWGEYLNRPGSNTGSNNPLNVYQDFFDRYVLKRLYEYYEANKNNPETSIPAVPKPAV